MALSRASRRRFRETYCLWTSRRNPRIALPRRIRNEIRCLLCATYCNVLRSDRRRCTGTRKKEAGEGLVHTGILSLDRQTKGSKIMTSRSAPKNIDEYIAAFAPEVQSILKKIR